MLLTTVLLLRHCHTALPAILTVCVTIALPYTVWLLCHLQITLVVSYCFASVTWFNQYHACLPRMLLTHCYIALLVILLCLLHVAFIMQLATGILLVLLLGLLGEMRCLTVLLHVCTCTSLSHPPYLVWTWLLHCFNLMCLLDFLMLKWVWFQHAHVPHPISLCSKILARTLHVMLSFPCQACSASLVAYCLATVLLVLVLQHLSTCYCFFQLYYSPDTLLSYPDFITIILPCHSDVALPVS